MPAAMSHRDQAMYTIGVRVPASFQPAASSAPSTPNNSARAMLAAAQGQAGLARVRQKFSLGAMMSAYGKVYDALL